MSCMFNENLWRSKMLENIEFTRSVEVLVTLGIIVGVISVVWYKFFKFIESMNIFLSFITNNIPHRAYENTEVFEARKNVLKTLAKSLAIGAPLLGLTAFFILVTFFNEEALILAGISAIISCGYIYAVVSDQEDVNKQKLIVYRFFIRLKRKEIYEEKEKHSKKNIEEKKKGAGGMSQTLGEELQISQEIVDLETDIWAFESWVNEWAKSHNLKG